MSNKMWEALLEHAKTCVLSGKLHIYYPEEARNVGVVFNNIYELNGLITGEQYFPADSLSDSQKVNKPMFVVLLVLNVIYMKDTCKEFARSLLCLVVSHFCSLKNV